jgi:hypothetical protein
MNWHCLFAGFNRSIWNALWLLVPISVGGWIAAFFSLKKGSSYYFDAKHNTQPPNITYEGDFGPHAQRYQDLAKLVIALSAAVIAFLINTLANEKEPVTLFASKIACSAPIVVGYFGFSIASLLGFMVSQTIWYEQYCHSWNHLSYVRWKYATCLSLGWCGFFAFTLGIGWLARNIFL